MRPIPHLSDCHIVWACVLALAIVLAADLGREQGRQEERARLTIKQCPKPATISRATKCTLFEVIDGHKQCKAWVRRVAS